MWLLLNFHRMALRMYGNDTYSVAVTAGGVAQNYSGPM
jgi:hypothetical protein